MSQQIEQESIMENIPVLALRGITVFPGVLFHFDVGRRKSIKALEYAMSHGQKVFLVSQKDTMVDDPAEEDLHTIGTFCVVRQILKIPGDSVRVLVEGQERARLDALDVSAPYLSAKITIIHSREPLRHSKRDVAMLRTLQELFLDYTGFVPRLTGDIIMNVVESQDMCHVSDYIAQNIQLKYTEKQEILEQIDPRRRTALLIKILTEEIDILALEQELQERVRDQVDKNQRDYYLREQAKIINEELGDGEDSTAEAQEYLDKIHALKLEPESEDKLVRQANRLARMQSSSPESAVIRSYLDVCLDIPWNTLTKENGDIKKAENTLNADHYGMEKVKERILEFFAVKNMVGGIKGQIICLVGPPGVGKTSVARSIARCMGRKYARLSLGGVRDEADIRGHRKTYIGAMPGRIITALRQAKAKNCLILIDEIDKLGNDYKGDPASALLEVFDTEQNIAFRDHFVELPVDLSEVLFITTANDLDTIPRPLLDRMEVISLGGYTDEEKVEIVRRHILPKQLKKHGLKTTNLKLNDDVLRRVIYCYTKEAGVRGLEREIAKLCRKTAKYMTETGKRSLVFTLDNLQAYLGTPRYKHDAPLLLPECGVVNGLAWTQAGGDMLEVECSLVPGTGKQLLTGNLGDVMKESTRAALTYLRSRIKEFHLPENFYKDNDIHIHFPEGAVPKDGPSAGITTCTALYSAIMELPVPKDIAMTGEISLRGRVLPIGGLREKSMAAYRNGVTRVIIPLENEPDLQDIDQKVRQKLTFYPVSHMDQVIQKIFQGSESAEKKKKPETDLAGLMVPPTVQKPHSEVLQ